MGIGKYQMLIEQQIFDRLSTDTTISGYVGNRVFPSLPTEEDPQLPFIWFVQSSVLPFYSLGGTTGTTRQEFEIQVWAETFQQAGDIADAVRVRLDKFSGGNIQECFFAGMNSDESEDLGCCKVLDFVFFFTG
ncbi:DUF3168 domain-containing protein [Zavarzinella formosa]|uniref:DUF3168 domain-containing protein n=1 Tax=Zavarzinella formosa TaxID=360055 RepID=UPI0003786871|nr:DUF3168 domain-containing protein [Zavarzinella formosa]